MPGYLFYKNICVYYILHCYMLDFTSGNTELEECLRLMSDNFVTPCQYIFHFVMIIFPAVKGLRKTWERIDQFGWIFFQSVENPELWLDANKGQGLFTGGEDRIAIFPNARIGVEVKSVEWSDWNFFQIFINQKIVSSIQNEINNKYIRDIKYCERNERKERKVSIKYEFCLFF